MQRNILLVQRKDFSATAHNELKGKILVLNKDLDNITLAGIYKEAKKCDPKNVDVEVLTSLKAGTRVKVQGLMGHIYEEVEEENISKLGLLPPLFYCLFCSSFYGATAKPIINNLIFYLNGMLIYMAHYTILCVR